mmetsp:Transcript_36556/g.61594  ORF Transcript_36556/g.61594 Transcript_36556/m.61594 type:complete len:203 (+) Transcript_36556:1883-2491(+)
MMVVWMAISISAAKTRSGKVSAVPSRSPAPGARCSSIHCSSFVKRRMDAFAVASTKLASSRPSPASARLILMASALYSSMACLSVLKLPVDLLIFSLFSIRCPLQRNERGHSFFGKMAVWLYTVKVRWFWIRSLPDTRRSNGYQKLNSRRMRSSFSLGTLHASGHGLSRKMWSNTASVTSSALIRWSPLPNMSPSCSTCAMV